MKNVDKVKCFFCSYPKQRADARNLILKRGKTCFAILNRYPYNTGHLMIAPYRHTPEPGELTPEEVAEMHALTVDMKGRLGRALKPHGFNLGMNLGRVAGAGLPGHLHMHVVPRWDGDTNFMPVLGDTKVLPVSLKDVHAALTRGRRLKKSPRKRR